MSSPFNFGSKKRFVNSCLSRCVLIKCKMLIPWKLLCLTLHPEMDQKKMSKKENTEKVPHQPAWCDENFISTRVLVRKNIKKNHRQPIDETKVLIMGQPSSIMGRNSLNNFFRVHICTYCKLRFCLVPESLSIPSLSWGMLRDLISPEKNDWSWGVKNIMKSVISQNRGKQTFVPISDGFGE